MGIFDWMKGKDNKAEIRGVLKDASWWKSVFTGAATFSGKTVSPDSALRQPAVFACIRVISEDVASLPIKIYSKVSDMVREPIANHPVSTLFGITPNSEMTPFTFMETMTAHVLLYGNAYAEIERNNAGTPIGLWILLPEYMQTEIYEGSVRYNYMTANGQVTLSNEQVLHIKGLGHDGIMGYSPISYAKQTIGISQAMEESGGTFFANSSRPSGVLEHPAKLSEDASKRLRSGWDAMYSGSCNVGKTAILEEGMKWNTLTIPNQDAQWLEARQFALQDIARIYRVPPHMIGDLSRATFSNIESQQIAYMQQTLMPWLRRWEQEINKKLVGTQDRSVYAQFLVEEAMRGNTIDRFAAYRTARETGWLSVNEIRKRENLNPVEGGDSFIQPLNFADVNLASEMQKPSEARSVNPEEQERVLPDDEGKCPDGYHKMPADDEHDTEWCMEGESHPETYGYDEWMIDSIGRTIAIIRNASNRKAKKLDEKEWEEWISEDDQSLCRKAEEIMLPACRNAGLCEQEVVNGLIVGFRTKLGEQKTLEDRVEMCSLWASDALSQWSNTHE